QSSNGTFGKTQVASDRGEAVAHGVGRHAFQTSSCHKTRPSALQAVIVPCLAKRREHVGIAWYTQSVAKHLERFPANRTHRRPAFAVMQTEAAAGLIDFIPA